MEEHKFLVPSDPSTKICEDLAEELEHAASNTLVQAILLLNDAEDTTSFPRLSQRDFPTRQDYKRALLERGLDYVSKKVQPILDKLERISLRIHRGSELFGMIHIEGTPEAIQQAATLPEVRRVALNTRLQAPTDSISSSASPISRPMEPTKISPELAKQLSEAASNEFLQAVLFLDGFEPNQRPPRPSRQNYTDKQAYKRDFFEQQRAYAQEKAKVVIDQLKGMDNLRVIEGTEIFGTIDIDGTPEAIQQAAQLPQVLRVTSNAKLLLPTVSDESTDTTNDAHTASSPTLETPIQPIEEPISQKEPPIDPPPTIELRETLLQHFPAGRPLFTRDLDKDWGLWRESLSRVPHKEWASLMSAAEMLEARDHLRASAREMDRLTSGMPREDRQIINLFVQGFGPDEIAKTLGISDLRKIQRLIRKLRDYLGI